MSGNKISITMVVNGQPYPIEINIKAPLHVAAKEVLHVSGNSGQPLENWELRDVAGKVLDLNSKAEDHAITAGAKLFLSLKAGVGGRG